MAGSAANIYGREIHDHFGIYRAVWDPGTPLSLGDIGTLEGEAFIAQDSLGKQGIDFTVREDTTPQRYDYTSSTGVTFSAKAKGEVSADLPHVPQAKAGLAIKFSRQGATVMKLRDCFDHRIENQFQVERDILARWAAGDWFKEWIVITQLVVSSTGSILVSNSSESGLEVTAEAEIGPDDLANVGLGLTLAHEENLAFRAIAENGLTPILQGRRVKTHIIRRPGLEPEALTPDAPAEVLTPELAMEDV